MEVFSASVNEVWPFELLGIRQLVSLDLIIKWLSNTFLLVISEQGRNHTDGQDVVNEFQETLVSNMRISEHEGTRLGNNFLIESTQILTEIFFFVVSGQFDSENIISSYKSGKSSKRLLTGTTITDEQSATSWESDDSMDPGQVIQCIVKEHEVHGFDLVVVCFEHLFHLISNRLEIT